MQPRLCFIALLSGRTALVRALVVSYSRCTFKQLIAYGLCKNEFRDYNSM